MKTSIKSRLLMLVAMPILAIIGLAVGKIVFDLSIKENLKITKSRILEVEALSGAIHSMQIERGLSVGFVASKGEKNRDKLPEIRKKVDSAIEEAKKIYVSSNGDTSVFNSLGELAKKRGEVDLLSLSGPDTGAYFTKAIVSLVDASTIIPSQMDDKDSRNIIQAYTHLSSVKEQLGQIRAKFKRCLYERCIFRQYIFCIFRELGRFTT